MDAKNRKGKEKERGEAWQKAWSKVSRKFREAEEKLDVEKCTNYGALPQFRC